MMAQYDDVGAYRQKLMGTIGAEAGVYHFATIDLSESD